MEEETHQLFFTVKMWLQKPTMHSMVEVMYGTATLREYMQRELNYCEGAGDVRELTGSWSVVCDVGCMWMYMDGRLNEPTICGLSSPAVLQYWRICRCSRTFNSF